MSFKTSFTAEAQTTQGDTEEKALLFLLCEPLRSLRLCGEGFRV